MITDIEDKEQELEHLKIILGEAFFRPIHYDPEPSDPIDVAMAKYVNRKSEKIHVHVSRVDKGVYLFGSKQIVVKLEEGQLCVRVGGGYTSIDDFIDIYSHTEL